MARRRGRYSALIKEYRDAGGVAAGDGRLAGFDQWLKGLRSVEVDNQIPAGGRKLFPVPLYSFGLDYQAANPSYAVVMATASAYSLSGMARIGGTFGVTLGHNVPEEDADMARFEQGFYPALAKVKMTATGATEVNRRSGITNQLYKYTYGRTFGLPFGRRVAQPEEDYVERVKAVSDDLRGKPGFVSVAFENEVWRMKSSAGEFVAGTDGVPVP